MTCPRISSSCSIQRHCSSIKACAASRVLPTFNCRIKNSACLRHTSGLRWPFHSLQILSLSLQEEEECPSTKLTSEQPLEERTDDVYTQQESSAGHELSLLSLALLSTSTVRSSASGKQRARARERVIDAESLHGSREILSRSLHFSSDAVVERVLLFFLSITPLALSPFFANTRARARAERERRTRNEERPCVLRSFRHSARAELNFAYRVGFLFGEGRERERESRFPPPPLRVLRCCFFLFSFSLPVFISLLGEKNRALRRVIFQSERAEVADCAGRSRSNQ